MHVTAETNARRFTEAATHALARDEVRSTVPLSVLATLEARAAATDREPVELWRVDKAGATVLFALRTPPFGLVLAPVGPAPSPEAAAALGRVRGQAERAGWSAPLARVSGPAPEAQAFVQAFGEAVGRSAGTVRALRLYRLDRVIPPERPAPGHARAATPNDHARLVEFHHGFVRDVEAVAIDSAQAVESGTADGRLFVWERDGELVSMAQRAVFTGRSARVNLVYTPPEHRGHGYASTLVAELSQRILDETAGGFAVLFTNLANPTSNAIYQALGYVAVEDFHEVEL